MISENFLQYKKVETIKQTRKRRTKPHQPKPVEQEGMPQCQHYPTANHREDRNPK
jgi:hypothetical protein